MPEGDTVHQLAARLAPLAGRRVTAWDARVPTLATTNASGMVIDEVWAWGKHLFWRLTGDDGSDICHTHLRMDGTWHIHPAGTRWPVPSHTARLVVRVEGSPDPGREVELVGQDLGLVELWPASSYAVRTDHLGPDPLGPDWDVADRWPVPGRDEAIKRLAARTGTSIGEALLDQRVLTGLGTVFRAEVCFLLGLDPASPVDVCDPATTVDLAAELLQANRDRPVRSFTGSQRRGENTWVYGRSGSPCRRCGAIVRSGILGGADSVADPRAGQERVTHWCPQCQPLSRVPAPR